MKHKALVVGLILIVLSLLLRQASDARSLFAVRQALQATPLADSFLAARFDEIVERQLWAASDEAWHQGNYADVIAIDRNILAIDSRDTEAWTVMAWLAWTEYGDAEAVRILEEGIKYVPDRYEVYEALGMQHFRLKRFHQASLAFAQAVQHDAPVSTWKMYAHSLEKEHKLSQALSLWVKVVSKFPNDAVAPVNLARVKREVAAQAEAGDAQ